MCVIVVKKDTAPAPSKEILLTQFHNNPDGAGFMYVYDDAVHIQKGFMTFDDFYKAYQKVLKKIGSDKNMIFHFRISTQAGVCPEFTHPFPYTDKTEPMKWLSLKCKMGIAHNGIISLTSSYTAKDYTDTTKFINEFLPLIIKKNLYNFSEDERTVKLIEKLIGYSRLAFLDHKNKISMIGNFIYDESSKLYFSNDTYKKDKTIKPPATTNITKTFKTTPKISTNMCKIKYEDLKDKKNGDFFPYPDIFCPKLDGHCGYCSHCIFREFCNNGGTF